MLLCEYKRDIQNIYDMFQMLLGKCTLIFPHEYASLHKRLSKDSFKQEPVKEISVE